MRSGASQSHPFVTRVLERDARMGVDALVVLKESPLVGFFIIIVPLSLFFKLYKDTWVMLLP
jgi:hypothetical protein